MTAGKFIAAAGTLLVGGFVLIKITDTLVETNPNFGTFATAIIATFIVGAITILRRGQ